MSDPRSYDNTMERWVAQLMDDDEDRRYNAVSALRKLGRPALERALELARDSRPRLKSRGSSLRVLRGIGRRRPEGCRLGWQIARGRAAALDQAITDRANARFSTQDAEKAPGGKEFMIHVTRSTVDLLKRHGLQPE